LEDGEEGVSSYWTTLKKIHQKLKEESLDRTLCRTRFGRGYGPVEDRLQNE
jgi:hypothetical protein